MKKILVKLNFLPNSVPLTVLGGIITAPIFYILKEKLVKINIFRRLCCYV